MILLTKKKVALIYSVAIFEQKRKGLFTIKGAYNKNDNTDVFISLMFVVFHNQCCMCVIPLLSLLRMLQILQDRETLLSNLCSTSIL